MKPSPVIGPAGIALRDVQDGPAFGLVHADDVASLKLDLRDTVHELHDFALAIRLSWTLKDRLAVCAC